MLIGRLAVEPDQLPAAFAKAIEGVRSRLEGVIGRPIFYFSTIGSTNDVAAALAEESEPGGIVIADAQTAGRGRRGRSWHSPPGAGLYVSVVLPLSEVRGEQDRATALATLAAGVALAEAVERETGLGPDIKWPNDLLVRRRKFAGILAEAVSHGAERVRAVVLGYGINVRQTAYPPELREEATCLEQELGRSLDRATLCAETLGRLAERHRDLIGGRFDAILDAWRARARGHDGAPVAWNTPDGPRHGITAGVDRTGALLVRVEGRVERLLAGDVHWLR